jgi:hypothetical protein
LSIVQKGSNIVPDRQHVRYDSNMNLRKFFVGRTIGFIIILILAGGFFLLNPYTHTKKQIPTAADYKNIAYMIDGQSVKLTNGSAETEAAPGSASKITTRYFGNELHTDLNGDGKEDVVFLLTQNPGGSGTFFYAVAALNTGNEYLGSDGYLLGDRIAPQTTEVSQNPKQKYVVVVNYMDRATGESMITPPSVGKSVYLNLDAANMMWGIVEPNFEGESR